MDAKKLDEALHIVRSGVAEIELMKKTADNYVAERQQVVTAIDAHIEELKKELEELNTRLSNAKKAEATHMEKVQKALAVLKQAI